MKKFLCLVSSIIIILCCSICISYADTTSYSVDESFVKNNYEKLKSYIEKYGIKDSSGNYAVTNKSGNRKSVVAFCSNENVIKLQYVENDLASENFYANATLTIYPNDIKKSYADVGTMYYDDDSNSHMLMGTVTFDRFCYSGEDTPLKFNISIYVGGTDATEQYKSGEAANQNDLNLILDFCCAKWSQQINNYIQHGLEGIGFISMCDHSYKETIKKAGNCYNGYSYDKCANCGNIINKKTLPGYSTSYVKSFSVSKGSKAFTAKWRKQSKSTQKKFSGYRIRYSQYSNMKNAKTVYVSKSSSSKKISKLSKKKKYYVEICSYVKKGSTKYYSKVTKKSVVTK